ncbi:MAG: winged helix-turn-helix domain-containing protein [Candidatus Bathyarchaeota archaeon]|nr:winged helix-turn-helix domain-containing protein [Candidatus Bathyarchaeota archaeon]
MVNYRDRLDIIADILTVASHDAKKTQIMYKANLSYKVLQKYLTEIMGASLIRYERGRQLYSLTSKGQAYLDAYKEYAQTNKRIEKRLTDISTKKKNLEEFCTNEDCPTEETHIFE